MGEGEQDSVLSSLSENEVLLPSPSGRGAGGEGIISKLREKEAQNKRIVLIFDQFEEFFFVYYNQPTERRRFFEFIGKLLNDSQNLSSLKVVLSLREDYLHYLLECNQIESMRAIDQDILSKNVLYRVGNLKVEAAKALIQTLTEKSRFYLEPELIGAIADDLKDELGEVRPIELQVVGAQLQQEGIKTVEQYRLLGANPKSVLVERYLNDVIVDCGGENERLAKFLLFMLTDERGTRPLKTRVELEKDLHDLLAEMQGDESALDLVLEIFVRSGLVVLIPESPLDRYQLVHDYLAELIRASQAPEMAKLQQELMETKETLRETVDRLSESLKEEEAAKIKARKRSRLAVGVGIVASVLAVGAGIAGFMALKASVDAQFVSSSYKTLSLLNGNLQLEALVEAVETGERLQKNKIVSLDTKLRVITSIQEVVYAMQEKNRLLGHSSGVSSVAFSPDGKTIATGSYDNTVKLWNLEGKELQTFKGHSSVVSSIAFSPDGKTIATGSSDNTVKLWNLEGKELQTFKGHSSFVSSVVFSPDGKTIATGSYDKTVKLWNLDLDRQMVLVCYWLQDYMATQPDLQQKLATCRDPQTLKAAAPALIAEARTKLMSGKPEAALSLFQEAKKLDGSISLNPEVEVSPYFITKGKKLARNGDIKAAIVAYKQAVKNDRNIKISADSWNILCRYGSIYNSASQVIFACDNAVNLEPDNLHIRNRRTIARTLAGDTNGAISEIEFMLPKIYRQNIEKLLLFKPKKYPSITYAAQQSRLDDLKEGKNPFTDEKLEEWRQEAKKYRDS